MVRHWGNSLLKTLTVRERADVEIDTLRAQWAGPMPGTAGIGHDYESWSALKGDLPVPPIVDVSLAVVSFEAKSYASEWVVFVTDKVTWKVNGLATLRHACATAESNTLVIYGDNEFCNPQGGVYPDFKPDFDLELFLARDYATPICAVRVAGLKEDIISNRSELYVALLRIAGESGVEVFQHIPKMLASLGRAKSRRFGCRSHWSVKSVIEQYYGGFGRSASSSGVARDFVGNTQMVFWLQDRRTSRVHYYTDAWRRSADSAVRQHDQTAHAVPELRNFGGAERSGTCGARTWHSA